MLYCAYSVVINNICVHLKEENPSVSWLFLSFYRAMQRRLTHPSHDVRVCVCYITAPVAKAAAT